MTLPPTKIVVLGESGAGKSCLLEKIVLDRYNENVQTTIGSAFLTLKNGDSTIHIWDTGGQERFNSLIPLYTRGSRIILICSEDPDPSSFKPYIDIAQRETDAKIILILTKIDQPKDLTPILNFCNLEKIPFFPTSAKSGKGIVFLREYIKEQSLKCNVREKKIIVQRPQPKRKSCFLL